MLYSWLRDHDGNPCIVAPTGSGKSWIIAALCEDILRQWPDSRIIVLSHVKELLQQDAEKIVLAWPEAPVGLYSAGLKHRDIRQITVAGIQSIWKKAPECGKVDLVLVDEAHLINHADSGMYRTFLAILKANNPALRIIGLTATPYRLGHGLITEGEKRIFNGLIEPVTIAELVARGFLAPLRSKLPGSVLDVKDVHRRGGEYVESELQAVVDTQRNNSAIIEECLIRGRDRKAWLFFCTGVRHASNMCDGLRRAGVAAAMVTGETPHEERAAILEDFKTGRLRALTNVDVLTTGFDYPGIDLLAMCRPTLSPGLYVQMAGRGMRTAPGKTDCLVLDFAGNVMLHGPITAIATPEKKGRKQMKASRKCPACDEIIPWNVRVCPACGHEFPPPERKPAELTLHRGDDIMGREPSELELRGWLWSVAHSAKNGLPMIRVDYSPRDLACSVKVSDYLCLMHDGYARQKAQKTLHAMLRASGIFEKYPDAERAEITFTGEDELKDLARMMNIEAKAPARIHYLRDGKYYRIIEREWEEASDNGENAPGLGHSE